MSLMWEVEVMSASRTQREEWAEHSSSFWELKKPSSLFKKISSLEGKGSRGLGRKELCPGPARVRAS
jgi:hypothetical protein